MSLFNNNLIFYINFKIKLGKNLKTFIDPNFIKVK